MAVVKGVSSGIVTSRPTADPAGANFDMATATLEQILTVQVVIPAGMGKIVELGFWLSSSQSSRNYELGVYADSADLPTSLLPGASQANDLPAYASNTWLFAAVDIAVTPGSKYHLALQIDLGGTARIDRTVAAGDPTTYLTDQSTLIDPNTVGGSTTNSIYSLYAICEAGAPSGPAIPVLMNQYRQRRA